MTKRVTTRSEPVITVRAQTNAHNLGRLNRLPTSAPAASTGGAATTTSTPASAPAPQSSGSSQYTE